MEKTHIISYKPDYHNPTKESLFRTLYFPKPSAKSIKIPKWTFRAPNVQFPETDEAFQNLLLSHQEDIKKLHAIPNIDTFIRKAFHFIKKYMGITFPIELKIIDDECCRYEVHSNTLFISRNYTRCEEKQDWGCVPWKWDKAEIFWLIIHELNHRLQRKECLMNSDSLSQELRALIKETNPQLIAYVDSHYPKNSPKSLYNKKARKYSHNFIHYQTPLNKDWQRWNWQQIKKYAMQPIESESFWREIIVTNTYRDIVGELQKHYWWREELLKSA